MQNGLSKYRIDNLPQRGLVFAGYPISRARNQIQVDTPIIAKDFLERGCLRLIKSHACHMKMNASPLCINYYDCVSSMDVAQIPEDRGSASRSIKVTINDSAPLFTRRRARPVPTYIVPGILCGCIQISIRQHTHRLNECIDFDRGNKQMYRTSCCILEGRIGEGRMRG
jgi:hypothetical protein